MIITDEITQIKDAIVEALPVVRLYLFGSYAYGTPTEDSDYDFYVLIPRDCGIRPLIAAQTARCALIPLNRQTPVDILADYADRFFERSQLNTLEKTVATEGVVLYEQ